MAGVTWAEALLDELETLNIRVEPHGQHLELVGPRGALSEELAKEVRDHKRELLELVSLRHWPEASRDSVRRFGRPEARLYPFLGKAILTPLGRGRLVLVSTGRAAVILDRDPREVVFLLSSEVRPPGLQDQTLEPFEAVN